MNLKEQLYANNRCLVITIFNQLLATIESFLVLNFKITRLQLNTTVYKTSRAEGSRGRRQRVVRGGIIASWRTGKEHRWRSGCIIGDCIQRYRSIFAFWLSCFVFPTNLYLPDPLQLRWLKAIKRFSVHVIRAFFISLRLQIFMFCLSHTLDGSGCISYSLWIKSNRIIPKDHTRIRLVDLT